VAWGAFLLRYASQKAHPKPPPPACFRYRECATHSRIPQVVEVARAIRGHWACVVNWAENRITNGILEGFNSLFQAAKARG